MLFLVFGLGKHRYALDAAQIAEVLPLVSLKPVPLAPPWVAGLLFHHEQNIPVIDLNMLALGTAARPVMSTRLVLVFYPQAGTDSRLLGMLVEQATDTLRCAAEEFTSSGIVPDDAPWLGPVRNDARGALQWIRIAAVLPEAVRALLFAEAPVPL